MIHFHIHPHAISICFPEFGCLVPYAAQIQESKIIKIQVRERKDPSSLNRCDIDEIRNHGSLLLGKQQIQLQNVRKKINLYPERYDREPNYLPQSQIFIMSTGWGSADRYSCCSVRSSINPSGQCRLHKFCPYCSYLIRRDVQLQFVPAYDEGNWYFLTGSFRGSLTMSLSSDAYDWIAHWDLYRYALDHMYSNGTIRGFYMIEELAVNSIYQVSVLPHIHAIIDADTLDAEEVEEAILEVKDAHKTEYALTLTPDVILSPITSQRSLIDRIGYMFKPINLVRAYKTDWMNCQDVVRLNNNSTDLVLGYSHVNNGRQKMRYKGTLNSKCKQFIGVRKNDRAKYKPLLRQIQSEAYLNYMESSEPTEN